MKILALDSSGPVVSVALSRDDIVLGEMSLNLGLKHSKTMQPMVDFLMETAEVSPEDVDLFACVAGPGSFTGVRIGVCAVKAMAQAMNKPCVRLDVLEVLAVQQFGFPGIICPILDARRGQVYCAAFQFTEGELPLRILPDDVIQLSDFLSCLPEKEKLLFVGDGVSVYKSQILELVGERAVICPEFRRESRCGAACYLAARTERTDALELRPIYLRKSQAERERELRLGENTDVSNDCSKLRMMDAVDLRPGKTP